MTAEGGASFQSIKDGEDADNNNSSVISSHNYFSIINLHHVRACLKVITSTSESACQPFKFERCGERQINLLLINKSLVKKLIETLGKDCNAIPGFSSQSDLISGIYEGGFKVWECTKDLLEMISEKSEELIDGKNVLDLGCGSGLVGIQALLLGAKSVTFQDYNFDVLLFFTLPNILLNLRSKHSSDDEIEQVCHQRVNFLYGPWSSFQPEIPMSFDTILSSETIYSESSYPSLSGVIEKGLRCDGQALIASKTYYFGVGGGTRSFEEYIEQNTDFESNVERIIDACVQREIIKVKRKV